MEKWPIGRSLSVLFYWSDTATTLGLEKLGRIDLLFVIKYLFFLPIDWAGVKQSRSPGAEQATRVRVYQLPVGVDGLASLAFVN